MSHPFKYTRDLPTEGEAWYFWKPRSDFNGEPLWVFHDSPYGDDKTKPLITNFQRKSVAELAGYWAGPFYDPEDED